jgi:hypothetical protein
MGFGNPLTQKTTQKNFQVNIDALLQMFNVFYQREVNGEGFSDLLN